MKYILINLMILGAFIISNAQVVQWRGPNRDGHFNEQGLLKEWPENGPTQLLEVEGIGKGYSSPVYTDGLIYITGMIDTLDYLSAVDMQGNVKWQKPYGRSWTQSFPDTRSTPVVEDNRLYVQSGTGEVSCFDRFSGDLIWSVPVDKNFETEYHLWGNSETPLIDGNLVICSPGGKSTSIVALNKMNGELVWKTESLGGPRAYASPTTYDYNGKHYVLAVIGTHLMAVDPANGDLVWSYKYYNPEKWDQTGLIWANTPVFRGNNIFVSKGYDYKAVMLKVDPSGTSVSEKFIDTIFDNHHHGLILYGDYLYGSNWQDNKRGKWVCMDWNSGKIMYEADWDTKGSVVMADGMLYCYNERGNVGLVKPDPEKWEVVSEFKVPAGSGPHWAHPFVADGKLFLRHGDALMVYDIKAQ